MSWNLSHTTRTLVTIGDERWTLTYDYGLWRCYPSRCRCDSWTIAAGRCECEPTIHDTREAAIEAALDEVGAGPDYETIAHFRATGSGSKQ